MGFDNFSEEMLAKLAKHKISDTLMKELAGNAFQGQVIGAMILAVFANLDKKYLEALAARPRPAPAPAPAPSEDSGSLDAICAVVG